jgi:hypothetical protein
MVGCWNSGTTTHTSSTTISRTVIVVAEATVQAGRKGNFLFGRLFHVTNASIAVLDVSIVQVYPAKGVHRQFDQGGCNEKHPPLTRSFVSGRRAGVRNAAQGAAVSLRSALVSRRLHVLRQWPLRRMGRELFQGQAVHSRSLQSPHAVSHLRPEVLRVPAGLLQPRSRHGEVARLCSPLPVRTAAALPAPHPVPSAVRAAAVWTSPASRMRLAAHQGTDQVVNAHKDTETTPGYGWGLFYI